MANPTPAAEIDITTDLVRQLLAEQAPALADLPVEVLASGWDNTIVTLGVDYLVRVPRRQAAVDLVENEQRWLPTLAGRLPIAVPVPIVLGRPTSFFPWPWSVVDHVVGFDAISTPPDPGPAVEVMAGFFAAMHVPAPDDAPLNPWRGGPLAERAEVTQRRFEELAAWLNERVDKDQLQQLWKLAVDAEPHGGSPVWIHGDMHPGNVIVRDGQIVSVIDFGDLTSGDPATDLGSAWMFFDQVDRLRFRQLLDVDDATWARARGWALSVALAIAENSSDNPRYEAMSARILARVVADAL